MVFSRVGLVALSAFAAVPLVAHAQPATPIDQIPLRSIGDDSTIALADLRGHFVALHFLGVGDHAGHLEFIRQTLTNAPRVAGVRHLFVHLGAPQDGHDLLANAEADGLHAEIYHDEGDALAAALALAGDDVSIDPATLAPVTVVFETDGTELFRLSGTGPHEHASFDTFAARMREKSVTPAIAEYNLPRRSRLAVEGYDVVAYFTQNRGVRGLERFTSEYRSIEYRFATAADRELFAADPEKYMPTYGGWCASAMGDGGRKVEISPTNFEIDHGRLHLFYKDLISNARSDWDRHPEWERQADQHWRRIAREEPRVPE